MMVRGSGLWLRYGGDQGNMVFHKSNCTSPGLPVNCTSSNPERADLCSFVWNSVLIYGKAYKCIYINIHKSSYWRVLSISFLKTRKVTILRFLLMLIIDLCCNMTQALVQLLCIKAIFLFICSLVSKYISLFTINTWVLFSLMWFHKPENPTPYRDCIQHCSTANPIFC